MALFCVVVGGYFCLLVATIAACLVETNKQYSKTWFKCGNKKFLLYCNIRPFVQNCLSAMFSSEILKVTLKYAPIIFC